MTRLTLNSMPLSVFSVNEAEVANADKKRADIVAKGRMLAYAHAQKGVNSLGKALGKNSSEEVMLNSAEYKALNEQFQHDHLMYAAELACNQIGTAAPANWEEFRKQSLNYYGNSRLYAVLQGIYQEIVTPILPRVYSEAVADFAEVVEVGFMETEAITIGSNDIPVFQDSAWGASRSVPRNRLYPKTYTLNPTPKTAAISAKWTQLVGNNMDFGAFFANLAAGMYAKTMGMWSAMMTTITTGTSYIPSGLQYAFNSGNWVTLANKLSALNSTPISNIFAFGGAVALSKVLPTNTTGSTNVNMDAAIATLLGADYTKSGYLGEFMSVRLRPLVDAVVPGTQNGDVSTILDQSKVYMMAGNGRKPLTIAYNRDTPITIEMDPTKTADFEIGMNVTIALDSVATIASKIGFVTIS